MAHRVTLIPGDGIGPEVAAVARRVVDATGAAIEWDVQPAGAEAIAGEGTPLPRRVVDAVAASGVALKGPLATPPGHPSPNVALRRELDLFASVRPARAPDPGGPPIDVVTIRMNLEDLLAGIELPADEAVTAEVRDLIGAARGIDLGDAGLSIKPLTPARARQLHELAFDYAERHGRKRITAVHKATVQRATDAVFVAVGREVAAEHPGIAYDDRLVDALCHDLVRKPDRYDVLVAPALYGDIVSDVAAAVAGGLGLACNSNLGEHAAVFEAVHGTAERLAGRDVANPLALVGAGLMLLRHIGEDAAADRLAAGIARLHEAGAPLTYDIDRSGTPAGTSAVGDALVELVAAG